MALFVLRDKRFLGENKRFEEREKERPVPLRDSGVFVMIKARLCGPVTELLWENSSDVWR